MNEIEGQSRIPYGIQGTLRPFWCRGYYVDTVGKNEKRIEEYVRNQLKEDELGEQIKMPLNGPFTGSK